ncbi:NAD(P)/FAD-dependent oxidoreductase [Microbacterium thalassium]|uniref:Glycine/D-amino acid oxidase-like deaminating enzyme n=1 Tax=Microbacterium thalassium TaxID=362649 RepID=A0A7X0FTT8_9MICO|nr:FAD-binding oxidoreductase [Microbacterium thalassium]MBB6392876.1 glycine/D-amino acid oxidase-like deaminating enzyme [Microbacterium thalassium]GLK22893.1 FAD-dependent oxidoreductase [Microbacterium thalassium]
MQTPAVPNGDVSWWWRDLGGIPSPRPALSGDIDADVAIVGAGYTGLWTAYYLKTLQPDLRITVLEQRFAGFGASGRNGGWLTNEITGGRERYAAARGVDAANAHQRALNETVDEVIAVAAREGIDADIVKGGEFEIARAPAQLARLRAAAADTAAWAHTDIDVLDGAQVASRIAVDGVLGGIWHPHCARVHPAKLVRGLAGVVEGLGVTICENTRVLEISPGTAVTSHGTVTAAHVIRATEGFTADLRGEHRTWLPMNSSMIVTEPLPASFWDSVGWEGRETLGDFAHVYMYAQRTADDRIAFGGRGVPYRYGSRVDTDGSTQQRTIASLTRLLRDFFPDAADTPIAHAWAGVLGVPRDWAATVGHDPATGLGWAGGYVGTGVTATNLAGRTLADLVLGRDTDLVHLPWVGQKAKKWEVEPLRWIAVNAIYTAYGLADRVELSRSSARTAWPASVADWVAGR